MANVLYLTLDGITDHIGQAQIAPYVLGLADRGHQIELVSAEKPGRESLVAEYRSRFERAGVRWSTVPYANRPPLISSFVVLRRMYEAARKVAAAERPEIVHCRSYLPFEIGLRIKRQFGAKLLLDVRDFWADVRLETSRPKFVYRAFKRREPNYFEAADHVITLTGAAVDVLRSWYPGAMEGRRDAYTVIPCCADFDHFDPARIDRSALERRRGELGLGPGPVLLYLGSLGPAYLLREMMMLFKELLVISRSAKFLFLSNNGRDAVDREAEAGGIPAEAIRFVSVDRKDVPLHIAMGDLSVVFIDQSPTRAGCSPTKLAELFALNVPVIANQGIGDMDSIIDFARNGSLTVPDYRPETLRAALHRLLREPTTTRARIRERSRDLSLKEAISRYDRVYEVVAGKALLQLREQVSESC